MKFFSTILLTLAVTSSTSSQAAEPVNATCRVTDASGAVLTPDSEIRARDFEGMRGVGGMSERFWYDVYLKDGEGRFALLDKERGEKIVVHESHFAQGETVTVSLVAQDSDASLLTLECVGD